MNQRRLLNWTTIWLLACSLSAANTRAQAPAAPAAPTAQEAFAAAEKLYQDGQWAEALAAFQKFETSYKFSDAVPQAINFEGWCWFQLKRYQEAANLFERVLKSYPNAPIAAEAMLKQAEAYRELGNFKKASELYRAFQDKYPTNALLPQAMLGEAWMLYKTKNLAAARAVLQNVRTRFPDDAVANLDALFLLGQVYTDEKNFDAARAIYEQVKAQRNNPRATEALFLAAETMYEAKRYADAIGYYERVQSKATLLTNLAAQVAALRADLPRAAAEGRIGAAQANIQALNQLAEQIRQRPDLHAQALFRIANCYQGLGKPEEASIVYRHFLQLFPNDPLAEKAQFGLVQTLTERGQLKEADAESKIFEQRFPKSALTTDALFLQAETLFGSEQYQDALDRFQKFRAGSQNAQLNQTAEFRIAACFYGLKRFELARDAFASFLRNYPQSKLAPNALFSLGRSHFSISQKAQDAGDAKTAQANLAEAAKYFDLIRSKYPDSDLLPEVTFQLGYLHSYLGAFDKAQFDQAVAAFTEFIKRWPDNRLVPEALYQTARNQSAAGHTEQAVAAYKQLIDKFPDNDLSPFAAYEIADAYARAGKSAEKIAALKAYAEKFPKHTKVGDALYAIGAEYEQQRKPDEAIAAYHALVERAATAGNLSDELRNAAIAGEIRIATLLEQKGAVADAVKDCQMFLAKFANEPIAARAMITQIASLYRKAKLLADAYATLDQLRSQYQQNATIRLATTTSAIELALGEKDYKRASAAALTLLADPEKDRLPAPSYVAIGNVSLKTGQFLQARDAFEKVLTLYPNDTRMAPLAQLGLAQAYLALQNPAQAETAFKKMIELDPQNPARPDAELGLAKIFEARGQTKDAVELYNKVMGAARGDTAAEAAFHLANFFFSQKDYKTALAYYLRVSLMTAGEMGEEAAFRAAQCHEGLSNVEVARNAYNAYLRRFPGGKFADEAKSKAAALPPPKAQP